MTQFPKWNRTDMCKLPAKMIAAVQDLVKQYATAIRELEGAESENEVVEILRPWENFGRTESCNLCIALENDERLYPDCHGCLFGPESFGCLNDKTFVDVQKLILEVFGPIHNMGDEVPMFPEEKEKVLEALESRITYILLLCNQKQIDVEQGKIDQK